MMSDIYDVITTKQVIKQLKKLPLQIVLKLQAWISSVAGFGLYETMKAKGYHDEPLKGDRKGQRSIRLNKSYRAIYTIAQNNKIYFAKIIEINKHEY